MQLMLRLALFAVMLVAMPAFADPSPQKIPDFFPPRAGMPQEVNGIKFADFKDFQHTWQMVTITYRVDVSEMRISYANDIAYKALKAGTKNYPDGAKFAKIVLNTAGDPAFIDSMVPSTVNRYQFMVRDAKKYAATDGWGYAIFDTTGVFSHLVDEYKKQQPDFKLEFDMAEKCHACHTLVKDRNYIFSRPMRLEHFDYVAPSSVLHGQPSQIPGVNFTDVERENVPPFVRQFVPDRFDTVARAGGPLTKFPFVGIAYEIAPSLMAKAVITGQPVALYQDGLGSMYVVVPAKAGGDEPVPKCAAGETLLASYASATSSDANWPMKTMQCFKIPLQIKQ